MSIAVLLAEAADAPRMIPWAVELARIRNAELTVVIPQREGQKETRWKDAEENSSVVAKAAFDLCRELKAKIVNSQKQSETPNVQAKVDNSVTATAQPAENVDASEVMIEKDSQPQVQVQIKLFCDQNPGWSLVEEMNRMPVDLMILPAPAPTRKSEAGTWQDEVFRDAPCDVMYLRDDDRQKMEELKVLVVVNGDVDDPSALQLGADLAKFHGGHLDAAFVEPDIDEVAPLVGRKLLDRILRASVAKEDLKWIQRKVVIGNTLQNGIEQLEAEQYDLVLVGTRARREIRSVLMGTTGTAADSNRESGIPAVAVIRRGISFPNRVWLWVRRSIEQIVPQLDRSQRVSLVERIQSSSAWNFDFVSLIFLSTLIAALGLLQDSVAVVIGAMLVAPLMTPIVGVGLGLAQGNIHLIRTATRTIFLGFATALIVGFLVGMVLGGDITSEMRARENPGFVDLVIGLASGIAAAYAMGRPNLLSALPGVAIAAALVPPVATAGIGLACMDFHLAGGALLLFSTNIVAITLGTGCTFWAIGLTRKSKSEKQSPGWPRWIFLGLVVLTILLTALMNMNAIDAETDKPVFQGYFESL